MRSEDFATEENIPYLRVKVFVPDVGVLIGRRVAELERDTGGLDDERAREMAVGGREPELRRRKGVAGTWSWSWFGVIFRATPWVLRVAD